MSKDFFYNRYIMLLEDLHKLKREGKEDTLEADSIRDEMDSLWYKLSDIERDSAGEHSEMLYAKEKSEGNGKLSENIEFELAGTIDDLEDLSEVDDRDEDWSDDDGD